MSAEPGGWCNALGALTRGRPGPLLIQEEGTIDTTRSPGTGDARTEPAELDAAKLRRLDPVPSGAAALAGASVLLLLLGWLFVYLLIYLPRGMVG
jgi:hypothetical protein